MSVSGTSASSAWRVYAWLMLVFVALWQMWGTAIAQATDAVCAEVKIVIEQKLSLERQAFEARMVITNGLSDQKLENVQIALRFLDANNNPITATADPNAVGAPFFYRTDTVTGITSLSGGTIHEKAVADINWLIIPAAGTGGTEPQGKLYYIGATLSYTIEGKTETVEVTPEFIVVRPQPLLELDYFLPRDVHGDDAFTPETEPPEPFTLGVRIKNVGAGISYKTSIDTAQPRIVENDLGLLIGFEIINGFVGDQPAGKSLLLDFGDIEGGTATTGRWNMITTLSGKFVEFNASFTHADDLGGAVTSLLREVRAHTLVHDVKVDLPGRDNVRDFLARDGSVLRVYESEGVDTLVADQSSAARLTLQGGDAAQLLFPAVSTGLAYARVTDPHRGSKPLGGVTRSDGYVVPTENVWLSKERDDNLQWHYYINVFDANTSGQYTLGFAASQVASLSGVAWRDVNNNGVQDASEPAMAVLPVLLQGAADSGEAVEVTAYTDAAGAYTFTSLQPGLYSVSAGAVSGFNDGASVAGTAGGIAAPGAVTGIRLSAGTQATGYLLAKTASAPTPPQQADLSLALASSLGQDKAEVGGTFEITLTAGNLGPATASPATVRLTLPAGLRIESHTATVGTLADGQWVLPELSVGDAPVLTLMLKVTSTDEDSLLFSASIGAAPADPRSANNHVSAAIAIEQDEQVQATQTLRPVAQALVYIGCGASAVDCPQAQTEVAQQWLTAQALPAEIVTSPSAYLQALRSGAYNMLWLHGDASALSDTAVVETRAAVVRGASLLLDGAPHIHSEELSSLWGGSYASAPLVSASQLLLDEQTVPVIGAAWAIAPGVADVVAQYTGGQDAAVLASAGQGQILAAGFELLGTNLSQPLLAQWLQTVVQAHLQPQLQEPMLAGAAVQLTTNVSNNAAQASKLQLTTQLPQGVTLIDADPAPTASQAHQVVWQHNYAAQEQGSTLATLQLPVQARAFALQSNLVDADSLDPVDSWSWPVRTLDAPAAQQSVQAVLTALGNVPQAWQAPLQAVRDAVDAAQAAYVQADLDEAVASLATAFIFADDLHALPQQATLQLAISQWLGLVAAEWGGDAPGPTRYVLEAYAGFGQSAQVNTAFNQVLLAKVTDQHGAAVTGAEVYFTLPANDASARFVGDVLSVTAITDADGIARSSVLTANAEVGSYVATAEVVGVQAGVPFALTNVPAGTALLQLHVLAGNGQSAQVGTAFAQALQVRLVDAQSQPQANRTVTFNLPLSGASGVFVGGLAQVSVTTDARGVATAPELAANSQPGDWYASAAVPGASQAVEFGLTNLTATTPVLTLQHVDGDAQQAVTGASYALPLQVRVIDPQSRPVAGHPVRFTAPATGASLVFPGAGRVVEVTTNAMGVATSPVMTANDEAGTFTITASAAQAQASIGFALTNLPAVTDADRKFTAPTPTGTGTVNASITGGGAQCRFNPDNTAIKRPQGVVPILQMLLFPHGVFDFELIGCEPGSTVTVTTEWPNLLNVTGYLKYGPTPYSRGRSIWYPPENLRIVGRAISYTITDGGLGDDDLQANGIIRDPGGPVIQSGPLPTVEGPAPIPLGGAGWVGLLGALLVLLVWRCQRGAAWVAR